MRADTRNVVADTDDVGSSCTRFRPTGERDSRRARMSVAARFTGDSRRASTPLPHLWAHTIGSGHATLAMRVALDSAGMHPTSIGYINVHGSAPIQNDAVETAAIKEIFGVRAYAVPISSSELLHRLKPVASGIRLKPGMVGLRPTQGLIPL